MKGFDYAKITSPEFRLRAVGYIFVLHHIVID
jgi:hypothetical protein